MRHGHFFSTASLLTASVLIHSSLFFSFDRLAPLHSNPLFLQRRQVSREKKGRLEFQFVEAPSKTHPQAPKKTRRISNRDSLNQDLLKNKSKAQELPYTKAKGPGDQLAQLRGPASQAPSPQNSKEVKQDELKNGGASIAESRPKEESVKETPQKPEIRGPGGADKITAQEMSKASSHGAQLYGVTSFEATGSGMGEYMKRLKERIWLSWFPYLAFQYPQDFRGSDVVVSFTLDAKGEIRVLKVVESEGSPAFASYCLEAVQKASGFGALPKEILSLIGKDEIEIKFGFHYR